MNSFERLQIKTLGYICRTKMKSTLIAMQFAGTVKTFSTGSDLQQLDILDQRRVWLLNFAASFPRIMPGWKCFAARRR